MQNGGKGGASGGAATAGGAEDQSFGQGGNNVALTPKQIKKQLKGARVYPWFLITILGPLS